jgi:hypothetical protein
MFCLTFAEQKRFPTALYAGLVNADGIAGVLGKYGVLYVIVPENAQMELPSISKRITIGA